MEVFVNREKELKHIDASFQTLLEGRLLLRTPIVEIQGIEGIGKTTLLKQIESRCNALKLPYILVDVEQHSNNITDEIITQIKKYTSGFNLTTADQSPITATKALLEQGPVAMLLDSVDTADDEQLRAIELILSDLTNYENLFVILTSRKTLHLQERSVARKLLTLSLQPLDRKNCERYLELTMGKVGQEDKNKIIEWTNGYPLALNVVVEAIKGGLDPKTEEGQKAIFTTITEQVINKKILAKVKPEELERYLNILLLLSVPRRFNLVLMQDLIEKFLPEERRKSSIAYFGLPKEINDATDVLDWNMRLAGFSVDEPIRALFLLLLKQEDPQRLFAIHGFLAENNLALAREVSGSDRARYVREYLYHITSNTDSPVTNNDLDQALELILLEKPATFQQFSEEFSLDEELKQALGDHHSVIQAKIDAQLTTIKKDSERG